MSSLSYQTLFNNTLFSKQGEKQKWKETSNKVSKISYSCIISKQITNKNQNAVDDN